MSQSTTPSLQARRLCRGALQSPIRLIPYFVALCSVTAVTAAYLAIRELISHRPGVVGFTQIIVVLLVATRWGAGPAIFASLLGLTTFSYFFLPPHVFFDTAFQLTVDGLEQVLLALAFLVTSLTVGYISALAKRRADEAEAHRQEIERLYVGLQHENDERKRTEEELKQQREHLERLVVELAEARHKAEESSRLKSAFLKGMSHELRTPLNAILGYTQVLRHERLLSERQMAGLATIQQSGEHLLSLINNILDLAKIEAGKFELCPDAVDLSAFLLGVADIVRIKAKQKKLSFVFEAAPDLPQAVMVDAQRLRQILLNLLDNAVKFSDWGEVALQVRRLPGGRPQVRLHFEVRDTGIGLSREELSGIFQPFEQFGELARRSAGTGLGLAISRQLAHLMGAEIQVASTPGAGSRFWFELALPLAQAAEAALPRQPTIVGYAGQRRKVLVADDAAASRAMLNDLLSTLGFEVIEAADGQQALERAQAVLPDLVVMDLMMPVMDGITATRRLRELPGLRQVPVLAVSAGVSPEDRAGALAAGAQAFLPKPLDEESLLASIATHLGLNWIHEQPEESVAGPLVVPPREEMEALHRMALTGNMRQIRERAEHLAALDARYRPFAERLRNLAQAYQSKAVLALISEFLEGGAKP